MGPIISRLIDDIATRPGALGEYALLILLAGGTILGTGWILLRVAKGWRFRIRKGEVDMTGPDRVQTEQVIHDTIDALIGQKYSTENRIRALQKKSIDDSYDDFMEIFKDVNWWEAELIWRHFCDPLMSAADENHILEHVDQSGRLEDEYVDDKVFHVLKRHRRLVSKGAVLPSWADIEMSIRLQMRIALDRFAKISKDEWSRWRGEISAVLLMGKDVPGVERRVSRI